MIKYIPIVLSACLASLAPTTPVFSQVGHLPVDPIQSTKPETLKVLLCQNTEKVLLEVKGSYALYHPTTNVLLSNGVFPKRGRLAHTENGMVWGDLLPGVFQMRIVPSGSEAAIFINGKQYKGCIEIYDIEGKLRIINEVDIESYLKSTLTAESFQNFDMEALCSIAIVARTQAYHLADQARSAPWHITAEEAHYDGYGITLQNIDLEEAINRTRHAILTYKQQSFPTTWTENCAGKTASFSSVFRKNTPTPKGISLSSLESQKERFAWSFQIRKEELAELAHLPSVSTFSLYSEKNSGKIYAIRLGNGTSTQTISFFDLQKALGAHRLKSNDFSVHVHGDLVQFKGYGAGSGVGLCLHSAQIMAKQGLDAPKILSQFYPETQIEKIRNQKEESR